MTTKGLMKGFVLPTIAQINATMLHQLEQMQFQPNKQTLIKRRPPVLPTYFEVPRIQTKFAHNVQWAEIFFTTCTWACLQCRTVGELKTLYHTYLQAYQAEPLSFHVILWALSGPPHSLKNMQAEILTLNIVHVTQFKQLKEDAPLVWMPHLINSGFPFYVPRFNFYKA